MRIMDTTKTIELKEKSDFNGLLEECLSGLESIGNLPEKTCKVAYYTGRIHEQSIYEEYLKKHSTGLSMGWISEQHWRFANELFHIGFVFPLLNEDDFEILNRHYVDPKYFDLLEDILFDQHLLNRQLTKYDNSVRLKRNDQFSDKLIDQVFNGALNNDQTRNDKIYFYNRLSNSVISKDKYDDNIERGVEFPIQFHFPYKNFADAIDLLFGTEVRKAFLNPEYVKKEFHGLPYDHNMFSLSMYEFETFETFLNNSQDIYKLGSDSVKLLKKHFVIKWLTKING